MWLVGLLLVAPPAFAQSAPPAPTRITVRSSALRAGSPPALDGIDHYLPALLLLTLFA